MNPDEPVPVPEPAPAVTAPEDAPTPNRDAPRGRGRIIMLGRSIDELENNVSAWRDAYYPDAPNFEARVRRMSTRFYVVLPDHLTATA